MRRMLLAVVAACGLVTGAASEAGAVTCVIVREPKPCAGVPFCTWGGDPDAVWVTIKAGTYELAFSRAAMVRYNLRSAKVKPRVLDLLVLKGRKQAVVLSRTYRLKGRHWYFSPKKNCWYAK